MRIDSNPILVLEDDKTIIEAIDNALLINCELDSEFKEHARISNEMSIASSKDEDDKFNTLLDEQDKVATKIHLKAFKMIIKELADVEGFLFSID